jgi:hypothetical protein
VTPSAPDAALSTSISPTDLVLSTPAPVLLVLAHGAPIVRGALFLAQLLTWTHPNPFAPWSLVSAWTAIVLGASAATVWTLPVLGLLVFCIGWLSTRTWRNRQKSSATLAAPTLSPIEFDLLLADTAILAAHLRDLSIYTAPLVDLITWKDPAMSVAAMSFLLTSYPAYLILTYFAPLRYIVLAFGLVFLTWLAPWSIALRRLLWRSAIVRVVVRTVVGILKGGKGLRREWSRGRYGVSVIRRVAFSDAQTGKSRSEKGIFSETEDATGADEGANNVVFVFTIYENQRWWVGLDWTQALLPNERPSWCVSNQDFFLMSSLLS